MSGSSSSTFDSVRKKIWQHHRPRSSAMQVRCAGRPKRHRRVTDEPPALRRDRRPHLARRQPGQHRAKRLRRPVLPERRGPDRDRHPGRRRQLLARREIRRIERLVQQHRRPHSAPLRQAPEMAPQVHVAEPGEHRPSRPSHRHPSQTIIDQRNRLDQRALARSGPVLALEHRLGQREERRMERQHARAVRARSFRKQDQVVPAAQPRRHRELLRRGRRPVAADEHRSTQSRHRAQHRPACDIVLRHEAPAQTPAQHHHVDPGRMVRHIDHRPTARAPVRHTSRRAQHAHLHPQQRAHAGPVQPRELDLAPPGDRQQHRLRADRDRRPRHDQDRPEHRPRAPSEPPRRRDGCPRDRGG